MDIILFKIRVIFSIVVWFDSTFIKLVKVYSIKLSNAPVTQLAEYHTFNVRVEDSSSSGRTIKMRLMKVSSVSNEAADSDMQSSYGVMV